MSGKWTKARDQMFRTYILLFAGLFLAFGLYRQNSELGPYWTVLIAAMLGLGTLADRIASMFGNSTNQKDIDEYKKETSGKTSRHVDGREGDDAVNRGLRRLRHNRPTSILV